MAGPQVTRRGFFGARTATVACWLAYAQQAEAQLATAADGVPDQNVATDPIIETAYGRMRGSIADA